MQFSNLALSRISTVTKDKGDEKIRNVQQESLILLYNCFNCSPGFDSGFNR